MIVISMTERLRALTDELKALRPNEPSWDDVSVWSEKARPFIGGNFSGDTLLRFDSLCEEPPWNQRVLVIRRRGFDEPRSPMETPPSPIELHARDGRNLPLVQQHHKRLVAFLEGPVSELPAEIATAPSSITTDAILRALAEFGELVRYRNTRRGEDRPRMESEADVQDTIYIMLRPWIRDLVPEDPGPKSASRFTVKDFFSASANIAIEAKFIRDRSHGKTITEELNDDIEMYRKHPGCSTVIFFIYDPESHVPDKEALRAHLECARAYNGKPLQVRTVILP